MGWVKEGQGCVRHHDEKGGYTATETRWCIMVHDEIHRAVLEGHKQKNRQQDVQQEDEVAV